MPLTEIEKQKIKEEEEYRASVKNEIKPPVVNNKNKFTAFLLAFFLGGAGIHKFYLGKTKVGITYLLFCWTFVPVILGFIEGIGFLRMSEEKFQQKYSK